MLLHHLEVGRLLKSSLLESGEHVEDVPVVDENALVDNQLVIGVRIKPLPHLGRQRPNEKDG